MITPAVKGADLNIPADDWNEMARATTSVLNAQIEKKKRPVPPLSSEGLVMVRNDTGALVDRYQVVGLGDLVFAPSENLEGFLDRPCFKGVMPAVQHLGLFAVAQRACDTNQIGIFKLTGLCPVRVKIIDDGHEYADVVDGSVAELRSGSGSARLMYVQPRADRTPADVAWCLALLGAQDWRTQGIITGAAVSVANIWNYTVSERYLKLPAGSGPPTMATFTGSRTFSCWNLDELSNVAARTIQPSSGVNQGGSAYPSTFNLKPLAINTPVTVRRQRLSTGPTSIVPTYWITKGSADDGTCE